MKQFRNLVFTAILVITMAADPQNDSYYSKFGADHTMVKYKPNTADKPVANCGIDPTKKITIAKTGILPKKDQDAFVKAHNDLRRKVAKGEQSGQPSAANMEEVKWDNELAAVAQRWAEQCPDGSTSLQPHDDNRAVDQFSYVGQNAYWDMTQSIAGYYPEPGYAAPASKATQKWYDEVSDFDPARISNFQSTNGPVTGHYTQVAWAKSSTIGCGFFMRVQETDMGYYVLKEWQRWVVCNYGPGGNIIGRQMYKEGEAGSACPTGTSNKDGLCG